MYAYLDFMLSHWYSIHVYTYVHMYIYNIQMCMYIYIVCDCIYIYVMCMYVCVYVRVDVYMYKGEM